MFPEDAEAGGGLFAAVVQLSTTPGSTLGSLLLDHTGRQTTLFVSAVMLLTTVFLTILTARSKAPADQTPGAPGHDLSHAASQVTESNPTTSI